MTHRCDLNPRNIAERRPYGFHTALRYFTLLAALAAPAATSGQIPPRAARSRALEALLFMAPLPEDRAADSTYSIELASRIRDRFDHWHRHEAKRVRYCEATESCDWLVADTASHHIARSAGADFYVFGTFARNPAPSVDLLVYETGKQGGFRHKVARVVVKAEADLAAQSFAGMVNRFLSDTLGRAIGAARDARNCWSSVAEQKYDDGKDDAMGALRRFPNHPSATSCLAYIYGAQSNPDSLLWALERAAIGDSAITQVWAQLGDIYLGAGDTTRAVRARMLEVETDPADVQRRMRVVRSMDEMGEREVAVSLMEDGVARFGDDLEFRRVLVRMCLQYEMWECAQENLGALYSLDPGLAGDTAFFFQMIGLAQATSDPETAMWWTEEAVRQVDSLVDEAWIEVDEQRRQAERMEEIHLVLQMSNAATLVDIGRTDSALVVYLQLFDDSTQNWRAGLAAARLLTERESFATEPLSESDSLRLSTIDSLLLRVAHSTVDQDVWEQVGLVYLDIGSDLVRDRLRATTAAEWLEKALVHDPNDVHEAHGNAMLSLALAYLVEDIDARLRAEPSCEVVYEEQALIERGLAAVAAAGEEYSELTNGLAAGLNEYLSLIPQLYQAIGCEDVSPREGIPPQSADGAKAVSRFTRATLPQRRL